MKQNLTVAVLIFCTSVQHLFSVFRAAFQQRSPRSTRRGSLALSASPVTEGLGLKSVLQSTLPPPDAHKCESEGLMENLYADLAMFEWRFS